MSEIGLRAARAIREMLEVNGTTLAFELDCLNLPHSRFWKYEHGRFNPSAEVLSSMAKLGYDIHYILTGERRKNAD